MNDLEARIRHNVRFDHLSGRASVKDIVWLITGREASQASQLLKTFTKNFPSIADKIVQVRIDGRTRRTARSHQSILQSVRRDRMGAPMLGMITYQEGMVDKALREAKQDKGDFLKDWEAIGVAETVTVEAEAFCKRTKGFELPMLQYKPPAIKQVQKALQAKQPTQRQQRLITAAMMPILKALPAPPTVAPVDLGDLYD